jgi:integrase
MSAPSLGQLPLPVTHATDEEYRAFLDGRPSLRSTGTNQMKYFRCFRRRYPDLEAWLAAPWAERVGVPGDRSIANCSYLARPYLYYLAYRGQLRFDWDWIIGVGEHRLPSEILPAAVNELIQSLGRDASRLGYSQTVASRLPPLVKRFYLHFGAADVRELGQRQLEAFERALEAFGRREDLACYFGSPSAYQRILRVFRQSLFALRVVLYHQRRIAGPPIRSRTPPPRPTPRPQPPPLMEALLQRYLRIREAQSTRPATIVKLRASVRNFIAWLVSEHPAVESFAEVTREQVLAYAALLERAVSPRTQCPLSIESRITLLSDLSVFFHDTTAWGWPDSPRRPLLGARDLPKRPKRIPRYIPADQLDRLMEAVRTLSCPYQRGALLIARWSGARRGEVQRLDLDCLDAYPDGTPRLRIPVGKGKSERLVPIHEEAASAIRELQGMARDIRGFRDEQTGIESRRLFVFQGHIFTADYLFEQSLARACAQAGLLTPDGKPAITAHQFRHTVGTELAEGGARLHTIMKMLGHTSTEMTLVYAHISDRAVVEDYQRVLGPGAVLAGPIAAELRAGTLPTESVEWLKANFFKTELELGHCLRLPQEGPCECDLYLNCAKFVTTREYAPRLRARWHREQELAADAAERGWERERERHACAMRRIEQLLAELGEPLAEGPNDLIC